MAMDPALVASLNTSQRAVNFGMAVALFLIYTVICFLQHSYLLFLIYPLYIVRWTLDKLSFALPHGSRKVRSRVDATIKRLRRAEAIARRASTEWGRHKRPVAPVDKRYIFMRDFKAHFMNSMWIFCALRLVIESIRLAGHMTVDTSGPFPRFNVLPNIGRGLQLGTNWVFYVSFALLIESWLHIIRMYLNKVVILLCRLVIILPMLVFAPLSMAIGIIIFTSTPGPVLMLENILSMYVYNNMKIFVSFLLAALVTLLGLRIVFAIRSNNTSKVRGKLDAVMEMLVDTWCCCFSYRRSSKKKQDLSSGKNQPEVQTRTARKISRCIFIYWVSCFLRIPGIVVISMKMHITVGIWITVLEFIPEWFALFAVAVVFFPVSLACTPEEDVSEEMKEAAFAQEREKTKGFQVHEPGALVEDVSRDNIENNNKEIEETESAVDDGVENNNKETESNREESVTQ